MDSHRDGDGRPFDLAKKAIEKERRAEKSEYQKRVEIEQRIAKDEELRRVEDAVYRSHSVKKGSMGHLNLDGWAKSKTRSKKQIERELRGD